ncbi:hypothetical protein C8Q72DRAFT_261722 [Fomitopsis betulina]|nr:hypothetical protein C8Q72DRAFT_261722 [Fomitopsis betulina]
MGRSLLIAITDLWTNVELAFIPNQRTRAWAPSRKPKAPEWLGDDGRGLHSVSDDWPQDPANGSVCMTQHRTENNRAVSVSNIIKGEAAHPQPSVHDYNPSHTQFDMSATCANVQANGGSCAYPACGCAEPPKSK